MKDDDDTSGNETILLEEGIRLEQFLYKSAASHQLCRPILAMATCNMTIFGQWSPWATEQRIKQVYETGCGYAKTGQYPGRV